MNTAGPISVLGAVAGNTCIGIEANKVGWVTPGFYTHSTLNILLFNTNT
jgi:hypothetical protein